MRQTLADLATPSLLVDADRLEANLGRMSARARELGVALRPHIKTHKCVEIGRRQRAFGIAGITVSTLYEAQVFADHGFTDITWAFPVILNRIAEARRLAERVTLRVVVDSPEAVRALAETRHPFHVWLKVDCGYHRAGVDPASDGALAVARAVADSGTLRFDGILSHSGHAYHAHAPAEAGRIADDERRVMVEMADRLASAGIDVGAVSVGSTPSMAQVGWLAGVTEARPGNYAFYDYMQVVLGSCAATDCALTVLASVVSSQPGADHAVIDAGALALSKDTGLAEYPHPTMGEVYDDYEQGTLKPDTRVVSVSQEHGMLRQPMPVGSRIRILPNHSCLTAAMFDEYHVVRGEEVVDTWKVWRGR
jgi:D-serine deaminase-like pyridoxal phosphate-dependent protein